MNKICLGDTQYEYECSVEINYSFSMNNALFIQHFNIVKTWPMGTSGNGKTRK